MSSSILSKELLIIFLSQFWKISRKKFERYSQYHHFIQRCLCRDCLQICKKIYSPNHRFIQRSPENVSVLASMLLKISSKSLILSKNSWEYFSHNLGKFPKILRKKLERYSQNHHFIQRCFCQDFLNLQKKLYSPNHRYVQRSSKNGSNHHWMVLIVLELEWTHH